MANNKNLEKDGEKTQFSKENQPANPGRRPSALSRYIKEGVSLSDIRLMIGSLIFGHTAGELSAMLKDKDHPPPVGVALILGAVVDDLKKYNLGNLEKLMDRAYGKPAQSIEMSAPAGLAFTALGPEERKQRIAELLKKTSAKKNGPGKPKRR